MAGGTDSANVSGIDKVSFPADSKTTLSATLTNSVSEPTGFANSGTAGYNAGGNISAGLSSGIDKVSFPADTKTTLSATLTTARAASAAFADSGTL